VRQAVSVVGPLCLAFIVTSLLLLAFGANPAEVLFGAFRRVLTSRSGIAQVFASSVPITLTALTFVIGYRAGLFNIGAEGAMLVGAAASIAVGALVPLPPGIHLLAVMLAAGAAGFVWTMPAAYLKVKVGVHEVISTVMSNYFALYLVSYLVTRPLRSVEQGTFAVKILPSARFPVIFGPLTWAIGLSVVAAIVTYFIMWQTRTGAHMRATGYDVNAARHSGINTPRMMMLSFGIGGIMAGLAGAVLTAGLPPDWTTNDELTALVNTGFLGIAVGMIGLGHPLGALFAGLFVALIRTSRLYIQQMGVAPEITEVIIGIVIVSFALPEIYHRLGPWFVKGRKFKEVPA
jgi:simple sugar transport system permease protein